jgi:hypothetical protein
VEPEETTVARLRLGTHVPAAIDTHATIEVLLDAVYFMRAVSYQRKVDDYLFLELLVKYYLYDIVLERQ